jgi:hypothetical protein
MSAVLDFPVRINRIGLRNAIRDATARHQPFEPESPTVTNAQIEEFNKKNDTNVKPGLTGIPFQKRQP